MFLASCAEVIDQEVVIVLAVATVAVANIAAKAVRESAIANVTEVVRETNEVVPKIERINDENVNEARAEDVTVKDEAEVEIDATGTFLLFYLIYR